MLEFAETMKGKQLNDVACCPNGFKLVIGNKHIELEKESYKKYLSTNTQCSVDGENFTRYYGGGYSVYRTNGGWALKNGNNWIEHAGGDDCCPRDGSMINFQYPRCKNGEKSCKDPFGNPIVESEAYWPQGVQAQIQCADEHSRK